MSECASSRRRLSFRAAVVLLFARFAVAATSFALLLLIQQFSRSFAHYHAHFSVVQAISRFLLLNYHAASSFFLQVD